MSSETTSIITLVESYINWLSSLSGKLAAFALFIAFIVLVALELNCPKRRLPVKQLRRSYQTNAGLFVFNSLIISLLSATPLFMIANPYPDSGLLSHVAHPVAKALLSFVLLDLLLYWWHKASHHFDGLWMFHKVHHNDPYLNVSTAFRLHIVELLILTVVKSAYVVILGVTQTMVLINEALLTLFIMFHHSNIAFRGEQQFGKFIIVPWLHRTHHSTERNEHDANYGAVFSVWDRLFGTLAELEPKDIGIKNHSPQTIFGLIKFGFTQKPPAAVCEPDLNLASMIAEAAYYKAEQRAFKPGNELRDWLDAKREILRMVYGDNSNKQSNPSSMQRPTPC
jgi:sterol desaturase/sphingolipid hydroxylase (fatty acid hydroxylase superfamily)